MPFSPPRLWLASSVYFILWIGVVIYFASAHAQSVGGWLGWTCFGSFVPVLFLALTVPLEKISRCRAQWREIETDAERMRRGIDDRPSARS